MRRIFPGALRWKQGDTWKREGGSLRKDRRCISPLHHHHSVGVTLIICTSPPGYGLQVRDIKTPRIDPLRVMANLHASFFAACRMCLVIARGGSINAPPKTARTGSAARDVFFAVSSCQSAAACGPPVELYILESNIYLDMSSKKEVSIGITINLDNYENIRLEVEGDAETQEDVENLILFLDEILARLGRGDPATAERVDAYRRRVFSTGGAAPEGAVRKEEVSVKSPEPEEREPLPVAETQAKPLAWEEPIPDRAEPFTRPQPECQEPLLTRRKIPEKPEEKPQAQPASISVRPEPPEQETVPAKPSPAQEEDVCEVCGAAVPKTQAKLSQLFMSRTLCKKCMERP